MPVQHEESYIYRDGIVVCFFRGGLLFSFFCGDEGGNIQIVELDVTGGCRPLCCSPVHLLEGVATFFSQKNYQFKKYSYFCPLNIWLKFNVITVK